MIKHIITQHRPIWYIHYYPPSILSKNCRIVHSHKCATEYSLAVGFHLTWVSVEEVKKGGKNKHTASTCPSTQTTAVVRPLGPADTPAVCEVFTEEDEEIQGPTEWYRVEFPQRNQSLFITKMLHWQTKGATKSQALVIIQRWYWTILIFKSHTFTGPQRGPERSEW